MKTFTEEELKKVIESHKHWLLEDCDGWEDMRADLTGADLTGANLRGADLRGADLTGAKNVPYLPMACPDEGAFIGWKKAKAVIEHGCDSYTPVIVKLRIPADARRSSVPFGRKCRCSKAKVVGIYSISGEKLTDAHVVSMYDHAFVYSVGSMVEVDNFCTDKFTECAPGIHFFMNRQEAIEYDAF